MAATAILGLQEYLDRTPKALSGGQRQRVAMGRAIVREPAELVAAARRRVVLADGSTLGEAALATVCGIDLVDVLVTDRAADPDILAELRARNVDVVVA